MPIPMCVVPLPNDTGIRLHIHYNCLQLTAVRRRQWWQIWKPPTWIEVLAEAEHFTRVNDTVTLQQAGHVCYLVTVNDKVVLRYPEDDETAR